MKRLSLLAAGGCLAIAALPLARTPGVVERLYGDGIGPWVARTLSLVTGPSPVSVSVLLLAALIGWAGWRSARGIRRIRGGEAGWSAALVEGALWSAGVIGALLLAFYLLWGLNYARSPLGERMGLPVGSVEDVEALRALTAHAVDETSRAYRMLHDGSDDIGAPTAVPFDPVTVSRELEIGWRRIAPALGMSEVAASSYGPVKTLGVTWILEALDISGVYSPFTGEAHISGAQPSFVLPATAAHEQAHQRTVTRENEASFAGALAAIHSDSPYVRYSGWADVLRDLQRDLLRRDREAWREVARRLAPGVERDWNDYARWAGENRSVAAPVSRAVNDAYLRTHGVPGGRLSYGRVTELLLAWASVNDGRLALRTAPTAADGS